MRILQITDLHLSSVEDNNINNITFLKLIEFIKIHKETLNIDMIVVTGDISHHGEMDSYRFFYDEMEDLHYPYAVLHGNHDDKKNLNPQGFKLKNCFPIEDLSNDQWGLASVNTVIAGKDYGIVSDSEMIRLSKKLDKAIGKKIVLFMHHHPIAVGTPLVDSCNLFEAEIFLNLCQRYSVNFVGAGHAHTLCQQKLGQTLFAISPAVCSQWKNGTNEVKTIDASGFSIISLGEIIHTETYFI